MRISRIGFIALLSFFVACDGSGSGALQDAGLGGQNQINMLSEASAELKRVDPNAFIIWGSGLDSQGAPLNDPAETTLWIFIGVTLESTAVARNGGIERIRELRFRDGGWGLRELEEPPSGVEYRDIESIRMDADVAWDKVLDAGLAEPFESWEVYKPSDQTVRNPVYVFLTLGGLRVAVDTVTGEVRFE